MKDAIDRYLDLCAAIRSPKTVCNRRCALVSLRRCLTESGSTIDSFKDLRRKHIERWLIYLATKRPEYSLTTRHTYVASVIAAFRDMSEEWNWPDAPLPGILTTKDLPTRPKGLPKPLSPHEDQLLQGELGKTEGLHDRALVLLRRTGLRIGELVRLDRNCLFQADEKGGTLQIPVSKLHEERSLPVDIHTVSIVTRFQREHAAFPPYVDPESGKPVPLLLCHPDGRPLSKLTLSQHLKRAARRAGIESRIHPHRLRHTYATDLLRNGVSAIGVMRLLGHRSLEMTLNYLKVTQEDLVREFSRAHEKAKQQYDPEALHQRQLKDLNALSLSHLLQEASYIIGQIRRDSTNPKQASRLKRIHDRIRGVDRDFRKLLD